MENLDRVYVTVLYHTEGSSCTKSPPPCELASRSPHTWGSPETHTFSQGATDRKNIQQESPWHKFFSTPPTIWMPLKPGELKGRARSYSWAQIRNYLQLEESENAARTFLVTQWIRIHMPVKATWVLSLLPQRILIYSHYRCLLLHRQIDQTTLPVSCFLLISRMGLQFLTSCLNIYVFI